MNLTAPVLRLVILLALLGGARDPAAEAMVSFAEDNREVIRMLFSADSDAAAVESDILNQLANTIAEWRDG